METARAEPPEQIVELWHAPLPEPLSRIAWHHWFVVRTGQEKAERYEVWQTQNAGGESIGHVHRDLMRPDGSVGGGPANRIFTWRGEDAEALCRVLELSFDRYPYRYYYAAWPGPNSNTFVAWVLKRAGLAGDARLLLRAQAVGKGWREIWPLSHFIPYTRKSPEELLTRRSS